jgi:hypothetical protein
MNAGRRAARGDSDFKVMKMHNTVMMVILLVTGSLQAADQPEDMFSNVRQIVVLKKGETKKDQIVINDPAKIKQLVDFLHLMKSDRLVCDMTWQVTFIKKEGRVETSVCKSCIEIHGKNGNDHFKTPAEFYKLVQHIAE